MPIAPVDWTIVIVKFAADLGWWSSVMFYIVLITVFLNIGFYAGGIVSGLYDLRFLLRAMDEEQVDETDDGRVSAGNSPDK